MRHAASPALAVLLAVSALWPAQARAKTESPITARRQLAQVMQDPMFHRWQLRQQRAAGKSPAMLKSILQEAAKWRNELLHWLGSIMPHPSSNWFGGGNSSTGMEIVAILRWVAYIIGGVLLLLLLIVIVRALRSSRQTGSTQIVSRQRIREALEKGEALATDSPQWIEEANRLAQEKDLRLAYRAMYLALLSGLHDRRAITFHQHRTNWTYVQHFQGPQGQCQAFSRLTSLFDDVWYGLRVPTAEKLVAVKAQVDHLLGEGKAC